ncbi:MAG: alpha-2-macroglobulin family protein, partial [bacterium]|nr:alpha-2-macroglobulin family protein [bacterium]
GTSFSVLEFRKPEYEVSSTAAAEDYFHGDRAAFSIEGRYYFGAPLSKAKVSWHAGLQDYFFNRYAGDEWYSFALEDAWCWWNCSRGQNSLTSGEGQLDEHGKLDISFPLDLNDKSVSQILNVDFSVTDANNQVVSTRSSAVAHKTKVYVGVLMEEYGVEPGQEAKIKVITLNPDGSAKASQKVTVKLFSRTWNTVKKKSVDGMYYYDNEPEDTFVRDTSLNTDGKGKGSTSLLVDKGGQHRVVVETTDEDGRVASAGTTFYAYSNTFINWPRQNNDRVDLIADKPEYKVGDTPKLNLKSPYQGKNVKALITVEREQVISKKVIAITSNAQPVEVEITKDLIPTAYVSAVIIKPRDGQTFDDNGEDTGMPAFKMGLTKLNVEIEPKRLEVQLSTDKPKYGPGETVTITADVKDAEGKPVSAELSVGVVDMSLQALLGFEMPDLVRSFYSERGLGVKTAQLLLYLIETFKPGSKGGGGGASGDQLRSNFKDTAFWQPAIITDKEGKAQLSFALPDNLTTWQILAIAHTKDHLFGAEAQTFVETKKTIVRPVRPRFAVKGDQIELGAIVHNFTEVEQQYVVTLTGSGFKLEGEAEQQLTLQPDGHEKLIFPITIEDPKQATFHFKAQGQDVVDEIEESIPVYIFGTPQSVATSGVITEKVLEQVYVPPREETPQGTLTAVLSPSIAVFFPKALEYLNEFPYGCTEQTVSGILPHIAVSALQNFEAFRLIDEKTLENKVTAGLERLYAFQRGDGGFGFWENSRESNPYLSAYVAFALHMAQEAGYSVDAGVLDRAQDYLHNTLRELNLDENASLINRAYILYVLAEMGQADANLASNLYQKRQDLPLFAKAYLAMALKRSNGSQAQTVMKEILDRVTVDARGAHFEEDHERLYRWAMNTNANSTAIALKALMRIDPNHALADDIARYMLSARKDGHWDSTQTTTNSIFALIEYLEHTGELDAEFTATLSINGVEKLVKPFDKSNILNPERLSVDLSTLVENKLNPLGISKSPANSGRLYYDVNLDYFLTIDNLPPADEG